MTRIVYILYLIILGAPLFVLATLLTSFFTIFGCLLGGQRIFAYYPGMLWSRFTCLLAGCLIKVNGVENLPSKESAAVYVANHQGAFDIFLIYGYLGRPIRWVMKAGVGRIPFVGSACQHAGFIFVDHSTRKRALESIVQAEKTLSEGNSIMIFPEASRTYDGRMIKFKKGAFQMATDQRVPIVPITINGSYEVLPINSWSLRPHKLELTIHPIIQIDGTASTQALAECAHLVISSALWEKYR